MFRESRILNTRPWLLRIPDEVRKLSRPGHGETLVRQAHLGADPSPRPASIANATRRPTLVGQCALAVNCASEEHIAELSDRNAGACSTGGGLVVRQRTDGHAFADYSFPAAGRLSVPDAGRKTEDEHDRCRRSETRIRCLGSVIDLFLDGLETTMNIKRKMSSRIRPIARAYLLDRKRSGRRECLFEHEHDERQAEGDRDRRDDRCRRGCRCGGTRRCRCRRGCRGLRRS